MKRNLFVLSLLLVFAILVTACGSAAPATQAPAVATEAPVAATEAPVATEAPAAGPLVLKIAYSSTIDTWDPIASFSTEAAYLPNVYETLLKINKPGSAEKYTPVLAESWSVSDDKKAYTFKLRSGVKFHDGEPMNAAAVKASIDAVKDHGGAGFIWWSVDNVEVVDDLTVKFNLSTPQPIDLIASSMYAAYIVSPKALEAFTANENFWADGKSYGTGPYMVESYTPDVEAVFTQNKEYWGGWEAGQYEKVVASLVPEATTRQQMLEGGEADLAERLPNENLDTFRTSPDYVVFEEPSFFNYVGIFNTLRAPLDDVKVRQALSYAIPYQDIITIGASGLGTQSFGPVPAGVYPWDDSVGQYTYDLEKAKALLKEAGHEGGGFSLKLTYTASNASEEAFAPLIKDSFAQIGVEVTIEALALGEQLKLARSGADAQDMTLMLYWPAYADAAADNLWSLFYYTEKPSWNLSYWNSTEYNALWDEGSALSGTDFAASKDKYVEAVKLLVEEAPGVFLYDTKAVYVIPNTISGFEYNLNYPFWHFDYYKLRAAK
jgi:peptide/nickel transport system substrate-binding protein